MQSFNLFGEKVEEKAAKKRHKSDSAYRTISEVADKIGVATHVLRFWETKFSQIKPVKRQGGRRYYRPEDVQVIEKIQDLLHNQGYTIRGVQSLFKENKALKSIPLEKEPQQSISIDLLHELKDLRKFLQR
jgi:DNA-binding transcriptional MerR regulator